MRDIPGTSCRAASPAAQRNDDELDYKWYKLQAPIFAYSTAYCSFTTVASSRVTQPFRIESSARDSHASLGGEVQNESTSVTLPFSALRGQTSVDVLWFSHRERFQHAWKLTLRSQVW
jgi:hypothetical protein